jgi:hypothetical protein
MGVPVHGHHGGMHRSMSSDDFDQVASYVPSTSLPPNSYIPQSSVTSPAAAGTRSLLDDVASPTSSSSSSSSSSSGFDNNTPRGTVVVSPPGVDRSLSMGPGARAARLNTIHNASSSTNPISPSSSSTSSPRPAAASPSTNQPPMNRAKTTVPSSTGVPQQQQGLFGRADVTSTGPQQQSMTHAPITPIVAASSATTSPNASVANMEEKAARDRQLALERCQRRKVRAEKSERARELRTYQRGFTSLDSLIRDQAIVVSKQMTQVNLITPTTLSSL